MRGIERAAERLARLQRDITIAFSRGENQTEYRPLIVNHRDIDREFPIAFQEFLGSIQRIDKEKLSTNGRDIAGRHLFFGNDRNAGHKLSQRFEHDVLGCPVCIGNGRAVLLIADFRARAVNVHYGRAGPLRDGQGGNRKAFVTVCFEQHGLGSAVCHAIGHIAI